MTKLETTLINLIKQANERWNMFKTGERLVIGISGGKDSLSCLKLMSHFDLDLTAVYVDFFNKQDSQLEVYCSNFADYKHVKSSCLEDIDHKKGICFSCSRQRKRILLEQSKAIGASKIIYGHHKNDAVETLLLNQIYSREICSMTPKQELFKGSYHIIRPMYMIPEPMLLTFVKEQKIPFFNLECDFEQDSKRKFIKDLLVRIQDNSPGINVIDNIFASMQHVNTDFLP